MKPWWLHWYSTSGECGERRQLLLHITASCTSREQFACQSTKLPEIGLSCLIPTRHEWNSLPQSRKFFRTARAVASEPAIGHLDRAIPGNQ